MTTAVPAARLVTGESPTRRTFAVVSHPDAGNTAFIRLTCSACSLEWDRDPSPRCPVCSSTDVRPVPQAVWSKSRGNQLSTVALRTVYLRPDCDRHKLRMHLNSGGPIPPDENPAAGWA